MTSPAQATLPTAGPAGTARTPGTTHPAGTAQPGGPPRKPAGRMALGNVVKGPQQEPLRVFMVGQHGVGKTTWASGAPDPIFLPVEEGSHQLDVARFPQPLTFQDCLDAVDQLLVDTTHGFQSLVVDTADAMEPLIWQHVVIQARAAGHTKGTINGIEDVGGGYGKGFTAAVEHWRAFLAKLDLLRTRRRMHVVLLGHTMIKPFQNPDGENFDRYQPKMNQHAAAVLQEWADAVLFAVFQQQVRLKGGKGKAVGSPIRMVHTGKTPTMDGKNRYGLPPTLPLDWADFQAAVAAHRPADPQQLRQQIGVQLQQLDPAGDQQIISWVQAELDKDLPPVRLARILDRLQALLAPRQQQADDQPIM